MTPSESLFLDQLAEKFELDGRSADIDVYLERAFEFGRRTALARSVQILRDANEHTAADLLEECR